jgi:RimJ/RimL family protein N-acetyltransferase
LGGFISVRALGHRETSLNWVNRLRSSAWDKGYATEGSRALVHKAFTELGAKRVVAGTMAVNVRSRRVMEKAGLTLVRTVHQDWPDSIDGEDDGDVEYALHKADWETSHGCGRDPLTG